MNGYYDDDEKITFGEAADLVERYIREHNDRRNRTSSTIIADTYDIEKSQHNLIRINEELQRRLDVTRPANARATQYRLERQ